ncbi:Sec-independent protein translocase protein TatCy [Weizmannia acidilactici]|uniref:Sec-independent protein translocase protein TatC n=1 Tax=Weizmannia acidilactici TaxID=2607726 RepID=A0A5J4JGF9_9BACI|nr:twin-arginine translocase subunit TatC [Weizmannia acidilactici]GER67778.1 Sec-independent protein translocase protein TatCy [Weizmannia acidilactici]GER71163.1 Sec-independent protein translocase protein TatCy [Weizmannia acidilactici]GER74033.1 Sec-independent protein translocase protein TatCy [Weizmannia acidilactici]
MNPKNMTVAEHIQELRKRLITVLVFFVFAMIVGLFAAKPVIRYLQHAEEAEVLTMNAFRVTDPIKVFMEVSVVIACLLTLPVILYQLWAFVSPGLYEKERKITLSYIPISILLFMLGISFSYFVLFPFMVEFMMELSAEMGVHTVIGIREYFQFLLQITLPFGFVFQMPVVVMFLTRLGVITPMLLKKARKYAYVALIAAAAIITPPDVFSQLMAGVPLILLYEISAVVSKFSYLKAKKGEKEITIDEQTMISE